MAEWSMTTWMPVIADQDGAVYNGKLFCINHNAQCLVYDLAERRLLGTYTLDKAEIIKPHANAVCFGNAYYAEGDKYPLLFVNVYNNYQSAEERMEGTCCVYRLIETEENFAFQLVQIIRIGFVEELTLWKSKENNGDVRPYGNFVVDTDEDALYAFVMRDADNSTRFFRFPLPGINDGIYSKVYGCNVVVLEKKDVLEFFDTPYMNYMQGCCYWNRKILSVEGFGTGTSAEPALRIIDLERKVQTGLVYFAERQLHKEPELICVENGITYYAAGDGLLRILDLSKL